MSVEFPTYKKQTNHGFGLFASTALVAGSRVQQFTGTVEFAQDQYLEVPIHERAHCLLFQSSGEWRWLIPSSDARFANHSCTPNSYIADDLHLVTFKALEKDEEITFLYNPNGAVGGGDPAPFDPKTLDGWDSVWVLHDN